LSIEKTSHRTSAVGPGQCSKLVTDDAELYFRFKSQAHRRQLSSSDMAKASNGKATIFEVAETAGVSITTVSHVFSGKRRVNEQTRQRVIDAADQLAYRPKATAKALATGRTNTLALQISATGQDLVLNPFFSALLSELSLAAIERDLSFVYVPPAGPGRAFVDPLIKERRIDGALLVDPVKSDPFVKALEHFDVPFVSIGRIMGSSFERWVDNDHAAACAKALSHLEARGYTRPSLVTVPMDVSYVADYSEGFRDARNGERESILVADDLSVRSAHHVVTDALRGRNPPDALFCIHDVLAVGALQAASELGVQVPEELGVLGVTDSPLAAKAHPPLSSVRVFPERAADAALDLLGALFHGDAVPAPVIVPTRLITRRSTARSG
jgi:LacI family transcriptional regulator